MIKKKIYTTQFKKEVVRLSFDCCSIKDLSIKMNVSVQYIYEWRKLFMNEVLDDFSSVQEINIENRHTQKHFKIIYIKGHVSNDS